MIEFHRGIIVQFGAQKYGFIAAEGFDREIYFHVSRRYGLEIVDGQLAWSEHRSRRRLEIRDEVVFELSTKASRPKAVRWAYASEFDEIERMRAAA